MNIFYKSLRVGKNGKAFSIYKFKTLRDDFDSINSFAKEDSYVCGGKLLRRFHLDELPQIWNVLKGDMWLVGPRPEELKHSSLIPGDIRDKILSVKPGLTSLSSVYFFDESELLSQARDQHKEYWTKIKPMKLILDTLYVENKSFIFDLAIIYLTIKRMVKEVFR